MNPYAEYGTRSDYLKHLSEETGVELLVVCMLADMLGPEEDFDGLVTELEDYQLCNGAF